MTAFVKDVYPPERKKASAVVEVFTEHLETIDNCARSTAYSRSSFMQIYIDAYAEQMITFFEGWLYCMSVYKLPLEMLVLVKRKREKVKLELAQDHWKMIDDFAKALKLKLAPAGPDSRSAVLEVLLDNFGGERMNTFVEQWLTRTGYYRRQVMLNSKQGEAKTAARALGLTFQRT